MAQILVVRVKGLLSTEGLEAFRDYVTESLQMGTLVFNQGDTYTVEEIPNLGGVMVFGGADSSESEEAEPLLEHDVVKFTGRGGEEKQAILNRLRAWRKAQGLGCLDQVARLSGPKIEADTLRDLLNGTVSLPMDDWRRIGKALDKLMGPEVPADG